MSSTCPPVARQKGTLVTGTLVDLAIADYPQVHRPSTRPPLRRALRGSRHEAGLSRRTVWKLLSAWAALWALVHAPGGGYSWHFFALGGKLLSSPAAGSGGLHLYAAHPELQFGPVTLLAAVPLRHLDPWQGRVAATVLLTVLGLVVLAGLVQVREYTDRVHNSLLLLTGLLLLPVWCELAGPPSSRSDGDVRRRSRWRWSPRVCCWTRRHTRTTQPGCWSPAPRSTCSP